MFDCQETEGNRIDVDLVAPDTGEAMIIIFSREMNCELAVCLSQEDTKKFKLAVAQL